MSIYHEMRTTCAGLPGSWSFGDYHGMARCGAKAGLQAAPGGGNSQQLMSGGDFIEAVNGQDIHSFEDLISYLFYNTKPGDDIVLKVWRNGAVIDIHVTLGERPN